MRKTGIVSPVSYAKLVKQQPKPSIEFIPGEKKLPRANHIPHAVAADVSVAAVRKSIINNLIHLQKKRVNKSQIQEKKSQSSRASIMAGGAAINTTNQSPRINSFRQKGDFGSPYVCKHYSLPFNDGGPE